MSATQEPRVDWGTPAPRSAQLAATTLDDVHRAVRHARAIQHRQFELAAVIREQPGRQAVRDGMADVLHWLKECACYDDISHGRCAWALQREREVMEQIAAASARATALIREAFEQIKAAVQPAADAVQRVSEALAPPPHRTGRAAQRSPYGPQRGR